MIQIVDVIQMIDAWIVNLSICLSGVGLLLVAITAIQYFTGRPYWGESKDSFIFPSIVMTTIPIFNLLYWGFVFVLLPSVRLYISLKLHEKKL